jgi:hypothetical protein
MILSVLHPIAHPHTDEQPTDLLLLVVVEVSAMTRFETTPLSHHSYYPVPDPDCLPTETPS